MWRQGSSAAPFGRIQAAVDVAQPGDVIVVAPGTYNESIVTKRAGQAGAPITVRTAQSPLSVTVRSAGRVLRVSHAHIVVDGLVFDGQFGAGDTIRVDTAGHHFVLRRAEVRRSGRDCVDMGAPNDVLIEQTTIHHCLWSDESGRRDAHGVVAGSVHRLTLRDLEIHTFSGDGLQLDPDRSLPGWTDVLVERVRFWLAPLPQAVNGFKAGVVPGENAVDTKTNASAPRARLTIRETTATGFGPGLISNMAAFNLKEKVDVTIDGVTVSLSEIAFRVRGPGPNGGARVDLRNAVVHHVVTGVRYEDNVERLDVAHVTFGRNVARPFRAASSNRNGVRVRNTLLLDTDLPVEAPSGVGNLTVTGDSFRSAVSDDYALRGESPAVDAGLVVPEATTDLLGTSRPQGIGYDIGAYEHVAQESASFMLTAVKSPDRPQSQIDLSWSDVFQSERGFLVERSDNGSTFVAIQTLKANRTSTRDTKLRSGRTYWYRVTALHAGGGSPRTNVASATLDLGRPLVPTNLTVAGQVSGSTASVTLRWTVDPTGEERYVIQRSLDGSKFRLLTTTGVGVTSYADAHVSRGATYWYRVRAVNSVGQSGWTAVASARVP